VWETGSLVPRILSLVDYSWVVSSQRNYYRYFFREICPYFVDHKAVSLLYQLRCPCTILSLFLEK
jgi:hypothetical protein